MNARASTRGARGAHARSRCQQAVRPLLRLFLTSFLIFMQFPFLKKDATVRILLTCWSCKDLKADPMHYSGPRQGLLPFPKAP